MNENFAEKLRLKLMKYNKEEIIISKHAIERAMFRSIDLEEVKQNIINPSRLVYAEKQKALKINEEKFDCYFDYGRNKCLRYILIVNSRCIVCTLIKINRRWQRRIERRLK